jgi:glycolate oxidase
MALAKEGLFYPPDPQSFLGCTIGGTVAENAGGPYCVKYGVTKQYVVGLEVVLASGDVMKLGGVTVRTAPAVTVATEEIPDSILHIGLIRELIGS